MEDMFKSGSDKYFATKVFFLVVCFFSAFGFCGLAGKADSFKKEINDKAKALRIVSLAPSNTELVYSLGAGGQLIAVSDACDFPAEALNTNKVGSFSSVKMEKLALLKPDLVLLVSGQERLEQSLKKHAFKTMLLENSRADNIGLNLCSIGHVLSKDAEARRLASALKESLAELKQICAATTGKPRVFVCVWPQPLMSAGDGSFLSEGIGIAGGINCLSGEAAAYPRVNPEKLLLLKPDCLLLPYEQAKAKFWLKAPWTHLQAVKKGQILIMPEYETDCLNRPTLRFVQGLNWLARCLHPELKQEIDKWYGKSLRNLDLKDKASP